MNRGVSGEGTAGELSPLPSMRERWLRWTVDPPLAGMRAAGYFLTAFGAVRLLDRLFDLPSSFVEPLVVTLAWLALSATPRLGFAHPATSVVRFFLRVLFCVMVAFSFAAVAHDADFARDLYSKYRIYGSDERELWMGVPGVALLAVSVVPWRRVDRGASGAARDARSRGFMMLLFSVVMLGFSILRAGLWFGVESSLGAIPDPAATMFALVAGASVASFAVFAVTAWRRASAPSAPLWLTPSACLVGALVVSPWLRARPSSDEMVDRIAASGEQLARVSAVWSLGCFVGAGLLLLGAWTLLRRARMAGSPSAPGASPLVPIGIVGIVGAAGWASALSRYDYSRWPCFGVAMVAVCALGQLPRGDETPPRAAASSARRGAASVVLATALAFAGVDLARYGTLAATPLSATGWLHLGAATTSSDEASLGPTLLTLAVVVGVAMAKLGRGALSGAGFGRVTMGALLLGLAPPAIMLTSARAQASSLSTVWRRTAPADVALPRAPHEASCDLSSRMVWVSATEVRVGEETIAGADALDDPGGAAEVVLALDERRASERPVLAFEASTPFARLDHLAGALATRRVELEGGGVRTRVPTCAVELAALEAMSQAAPTCMEVHLLTPDCPGRYRTLRVVSEDETVLVSMQGAARVSADAAAIQLARPWGVAAEPHVAVGRVVEELFSLPEGGYGQGGDAWLAPTLRSRAAEAPRPTPPHTRGVVSFHSLDDVTAEAMRRERATSNRCFSAPSLDALDPTDPSGSRPSVELAVATPSSGRVTRAWPIAIPATGLDAACLAGRLVGAPYDPTGPGGSTRLGYAFGSFDLQEVLGPQVLMTVGEDPSSDDVYVYFGDISAARSALRGCLSAALDHGVDEEVKATVMLEREPGGAVSWQEPVDFGDSDELADATLPACVGRALKLLRPSSTASGRPWPVRFTALLRPPPGTTAHHGGEPQQQPEEHPTAEP